MLFLKGRKYNFRLLIFISIISLSIITLLLNNYKFKKYPQDATDNNFNRITNIFNNKENINNKENELNSIIKNILIKKVKIPVKINNFAELREREELHTVLWEKIFGINNLFVNNEELKLYKQNLIKNSSFLSLNTSDNQFIDLDHKLLATLHQSLYPWLYNHRYSSLGELLKSSNGRGIVICTGDKHFNYARSTIDSLRYILNSTLPIEVFYNGDNDLNVDNQNILKTLPNVFLSDISTYFNNTIVKFEGWDIKPFSILASRFDEVILMDADVLFVRDPILLFEDSGYIETGTLFFKDRTLIPGTNEGIKWLKSWMIDPLIETKKLRFWNQKTHHEMESGVVVINKTKTILGLLTTCKFNEYNIRRNVVYRHVHGDKETFWMGFDMARQHYNMYSEPCSFIGEIISNESSKLLCGHVAHTMNEKLFFWNSHIIREKNSETEKKVVLNFEVYYTEKGKTEWTKGIYCMKLDKGKKLKHFDDDEQKNINLIYERERKYHFVLSNTNTNTKTKVKTTKGRIKYKNI